jgi:hypothetical protein
VSNYLPRLARKPADMDAFAVIQCWLLTGTGWLISVPGRDWVLCRVRVDSFLGLPWVGGSVS